MILYDYSQVVTGIATAQLTHNPKASEEEHSASIRNMFFFSLLSFQKKFNHFGKMVLCFDSKPYWRTKVFPYYKATRKKRREKSTLDWDYIHKILHEIRADLRENFPYTMIEAEGAEADDIIAVMAKWLQENELVDEGIMDDVPQKVMIISGDGDLLQLTKYPEVMQWDQRNKRCLKPETNLHENLIEHIVRGDSGDGIGAILSGGNYLVDGIRQPRITKEYLAKFFELGEAACTTDFERENWKRNQMLIDLDCIPKDIEEKIIKAYQNYEKRGSKQKMLMYFMKHGLRKLISEIENMKGN